MKKQIQLIKDKWYWIHYPGKKRGYVGPAQFIKKDSFTEDKTNQQLYMFKTPIHSRILFRLSDIKHECKPLPSYDELLKKCGLKIEDFK